MALSSTAITGSGVTFSGVATSASDGGGGGSFSDASCTDGTDCFCDCIAGSDRGDGYKNDGCASKGYTVHTGSSISMCHDFDKVAWDDGTGEAAGADGFSLFGSFLCPNDVGASYADEGTNDNDCYNFVADNDCDTNATNTTTDCALGNRGLGQKYDATYAHGRHADIGFSDISTVGHTIVMKFSNNFFHNSDYKHDELLAGAPGPHGWPLGQDQTLAGGNYDTIKYSAGGTFPSTDSLGNTRLDKIWRTRVFWNGGGNCNSGAFVNNATVTEGILHCQGAEWGYSPWQSSFPGGSFSWPDGEWACIATKITGIGSASGTVTQWWTDVDGNTESIIQISGLDLSYGEVAELVDGYTFNNYYNGGNFTDSGYCTSTSSPYGSLGCDRAYRYEENVVITNGDPVPCSVAMAPIIAGN